eukprot:3487941-Alexandrium_andersonii.AAC.1
MGAVRDVRQVLKHPTVGIGVKKVYLESLVVSRAFHNVGLWSRDKPAALAAITAPVVSAMRSMAWPMLQDEARSASASVLATAVGSMHPHDYMHVARLRV